MAWVCVKQHWRIILLCLIINLFIAFIGLGPLSNVFKSAIAETVHHDKLVSGFDFTLVSDIMREFSSGLSVSNSLLLSLIIPFFLWSIFCSGGFMALIQQYPTQAPSSDFWRGGAYYFFRYLRLSLGTFGVFILLGIIATSFFSMSGLSPFELSSEGPVIMRFWIAIIFMVFCYFLIDLLKELCKVYIAKTDSRWFTKEFRKACKNLFKKHNLIIAGLNAVVFIAITLLYFLLKKLIGSWLIPTVICAQIYLIFRIAFRFTKLASIDIVNRYDDIVA